MIANTQKGRRHKTSVFPLYGSSVPRGQPGTGIQGLSPYCSPFPGDPVQPSPVPPLSVAQLSWRQRRPWPLSSRCMVVVPSSSPQPWLLSGGGILVFSLRAVNPKDRHRFCSPGQPLITGLGCSHHLYLITYSVL